MVQMIAEVPSEQVVFDATISRAITVKVCRATEWLIDRLHLQDTIEWVRMRVGSDETHWDPKCMTIFYGDKMIQKIMNRQARDTSFVEFMSWILGHQIPFANIPLIQAVNPHMTHDEHLAYLICHEVAHGFIDHLNIVPDDDHGWEFKATAMELWTRYGESLTYQVESGLEEALAVGWGGDA